MNSEFYKIGLYEHNADSYIRVRNAYESGEDVVGIVHATGTGKTYIALQLTYDNPNKKIIYVVPSIGIIEHIKEIIDANPNLDFKRDFSNLELRTYQNFISLSREEIANIECDLLILDEFHHLGAPVWGTRIETMIETHPEMKIFGMTAYTVRDRGTPYERDMANPETNELFSKKICSRYDLCDAMIDGVLPKPIYKSAYVNLVGLESKLEEKVQKSKATSREYQEYMAILSNVKKRIHEASSIPNILRKNIKPNGKYIYFCPPCKEDGTNDIETIKAQAKEWFKTFVPEEDIIFYTSTSEMGEEGKLNRDAFYEDITLNGEKADNKLRIMFAINQYNEGIHAPNIDGDIMGRETSSDIVYYEQLGRALSVRGNTKEMFDELEKYPIEVLIDMCKSRDIQIKENATKEELIEKLIAPVVIDLTGNYNFIKELENNLRDKIKDIYTNGLGNHRDMKIRDASFDIEMANEDLYEMLETVKNRLSKTWEEMYNYAKIYYKHHGNLEVPQRFKTKDGYTYDAKGQINLGQWIAYQRIRTSPESERGTLLLQIGMRYENKNMSWEEIYNYAKIYYEHHGDLEVPYNYKTNDGYTYDAKGKINLGSWIASQRIRTSPESERGILLLQIGMRYKNKISTLSWEEMYNYAKIYYKHHGNLEIPVRFKTNDGYTYDANGKITLGSWISAQRRNPLLESERVKLLSQLGMRYENKINTLSWEEMYNYAKIYYEHHGDLEVPRKFKTNDGYTYDTNGKINLGSWIVTQRMRTSPESERGILLLQISMRYENKNLSWNQMYNYAKIYYEHHGDLEVPVRFKTNDGYTHDANGKITLGTWIAYQRIITSPESERGTLLLQIGMRYENKNISWEEMYNYAKIYYEHHGDLEVPSRFKTNDGYTYDAKGQINLGKWIGYQRITTPSESEHGILLSQIGMRYENKKLSWKKMYNYAKIYYEHHGDLNVSQRFKTNDGYTYDANGKINLGQWIANQRVRISIESERGILLSQIGMRWSVRKNKQDITNICKMNNIDYEKNKIVLKHISAIELRVKIEFLKSQNISLMDENGMLIDIFSMSNKDMQAKYGITLENILKEYYYNDSLQMPEKGITRVRKLEYKI